MRLITKWWLTKTRAVSFYEILVADTRNSFLVLFGFSFTNINDHKIAGEGGEYLFNSSPPLPPASQTLRH